MKSPKSSPKSTPKKPRENSNASKKDILELLQANDSLMRKYVETFAGNYPENFDRLRANLDMEESEDVQLQTVIMIQTNLGFSMALGLKKSELDKKEIVIATIGFTSQDGRVLNIIGELEQKFLTLVPVEERDALKTKLAIIKKEGVGQLVTNMIYYGSGLDALNNDSYAIKISISPGGDTDNPIVLCVAPFSKKINKAILSSVRNFLTTADELINLYRELQLREALMAAFSGGSEIMRVLEDESERASN